jgi:hypothetical protein
MIVVNIIFLFVLLWLVWMLCVSFIRHAVKLVCWIEYITTGVRHGERERKRDRE